MSGGRLVVMDRSGRDIKRYALPQGLVTLGSDPDCDIRVMLPTVSSHHASVVVRANQTIIRNLSAGETLVNGKAVSVAALRHGDTLTLGDRSLRWEYDQPEHVLPAGSPPPLLARRSYPTPPGRRRRSSPGRRPARPAMDGRTSLPGKQVAIVQPQRRDTNENQDTNPRLVVKPHRPYAQANKRQSRQLKSDIKETPDKNDKRKSQSSPKSQDLHGTTKATLWIESRKTSPRKSQTKVIATPKRLVASARKVTPLRTVVLRKALTPNPKFVATQAVKKTPSSAKVAKIQAPSKIDHTKQAALMLMTRYTPKKIQEELNKTATPKQTPGKKSPKIVKRTPKKSIPRQSKAATPKSPVKPPKTSLGNQSVRRSRRGNDDRSISILEITDSESLRQPSTSRRNTSQTKSPRTSPLLPTPRKSALKDPKAKKTNRKTDSIKFDLSNLENMQDSSVLVSSRNSSFDTSFSDDEITLRYSETPMQSPSPRRSINSRSSRIPEKSLGTEILAPNYEQSTLTPESPSSRKSLRGSLMVQKALGNDSKISRQSKVNDTTKTLSPRSPKNMESYSIVDLISNDSNATRSSSIYNSVTSSSAFGTPQNSSRKTRSTIDTNLLVSSTPFHEQRSRGSKRNSSPIKSNTHESGKSRSKSLSNLDSSKKVVGKRSSSLSATRSNITSPRCRQNDSDVFIITNVESPKSGRNSSRKSNSTVISCNDSILSNSSPKSANKTGKSKASPKSANVSEISNSSSRSPNYTRRSKSTSKIVDSSHYSDASPQSANTTRRSKSSPKIVNETHVSTSSRKSANNTRRSKTANYSQISNSSLKSANTTRGSRASTKSSNRSTISNSSPKSASTTRRSKSANESHTSITSSKSGRNSRSFSASPKSPSYSLLSNLSPKSPKSADKSTRSVRFNQRSPNEGLHTPENRNSPTQVGTPILSIQSLLDSSNSSLPSQTKKRGRVSLNLKRKTIGSIPAAKRSRQSVNSKSLTATAIKKSLRSKKDSSPASDKTDEGAPTPNNDETITPKSTVKLVQEAVKEKHSTAKKPQSKRSIIDNLNDSLIVKHLFNSPVKRKLSQSMTEFSRKHLQDELPTKKRTRKTIALGKTPDHSLLEHTEAITPELFVSPLNTPETSPNLSGIKRLFRKNNTPKNDLRNVKGVKALLKTPRTRRSIKNDLTAVSGIKKVFGRSPKNSLNNLSGVKQVFASSPKNDLRRISGVKSLFQGKKKQNSPKNDLTNISGIKNLYKSKRSPRNDLTKVSGVKKIINARSPKNDLGDVRGVKRLFDREKSRAGLSDLSGVEELFDVSVNSDKQDLSNSEYLFDQLVGKPRFKAYAKSLSKTIEKRTNKRTVKSLNTSYEMITSNVEGWLEKEIQKRTNNESTRLMTSLTKGRKSNEKSKNVTRELLKLTTDTVEGNDPLVTSRTRNSLRDVSERKSASQIYGAHTLPIKKRSLVEASLDKTANDSKLKQLPIKKRVIIHSTPIKGKMNVTVNASSVSILGRISPISVDKTNLEIRSTQPQSPKAKHVSPKTKIASPKAKPVSPKTKRGAQSPKRAEAQVARTSGASKTLTKKPSPVKEQRKTRGRPSKTAEVSNTKKRRTSLVITKKSPVLSPKPASPKLTRKGRRNVAKTLVSPKKVVSPKAKKAVAKPVAKKASPKKPPTPKKSTAKKAPTPKKAVAKKVVAAKKSPTPKKTQTPKKTPTPKISPIKPTRATRGRKAEEKPATPKASRVRVKNASIVISKPSPQMKPKAGKQTKAKPVEEPNVGRGRKTAKKVAEKPQIVESKAETPKQKGRRSRKVTEQMSAESLPKRGRQANKSEVNKSASPKRTTKAQTKASTAKGKNTSQTDIAEPKTRRNISKTKTTEAVENPRSRKNAPKTTPTVEKVSKGRKRKTDVSIVEVPKKSARTTKVADKSKNDGKTSKTKTAAAKKQVQAKNAETVEKPTRGRKVQVTEAAPKGRKRKSEEITKEPNKKEPAPKKARRTAEAKTALVKPVSPVKPARSTRGKKNDTKVPTASTRSKRR